MGNNRNRIQAPNNQNNFEASLTKGEVMDYFIIYLVSAVLNLLFMPCFWNDFINTTPKTTTDDIRKGGLLFSIIPVLNTLGLLIIPLAIKQQLSVKKMRKRTDQSK
jgi:hypothetical protein